MGICEILPHVPGLTSHVANLHFVALQALQAREAWAHGRWCDWKEQTVALQ